MTDSGTPPLSASETILINVVAANTPPVLASISNQKIAEGATLSFPVLAGDREGQKLTYTLDAGAPEGARVDSETQMFSWTPTEAQGPGSYSITLRATDDGIPPMSDAKTFTVTVTEVNTAPILAVILDQTVSAGATLSFTATATDSDLPAQELSFSLKPGSPAGATLNSTTGEFTWTPTSAQAPSTNRITLLVTDNSSPPLNDEKSFQVVVKPPTAIQILGVTLSAPEELLIRWTSEAEHLYRVQVSDDIAHGTWQNLGESVIATGPTTSRTDNVASTSGRFYRIVLER